MYEVQSGINNAIRQDATTMAMLGGRGPFYGRIPKDSQHTRDIAAISMEFESIVEPGGKDNDIVTLHIWSFRKMMNEIVSKQLDRLFHDYRFRWKPLVLVTALAPTLTAGTSGSLSSGTIFVKLARVFGPMEFSGGLEASVVVVGPSGDVLVTVPKMEDGQTAWKVYFGSTSNGESFYIQTVGSGSVDIQQLSAGVQSNGLTVVAGNPLVNSIAFTRVDFRVDVNDPSSELYHKVVRLRVRYGHGPTPG